MHGIIFKSTIEIEERHKEKIAKNLHDGVNSLLTLLIYSLNKRQTDFLSNKFRESDLEEDKELIRRIIKEIKNTCHDLIPSSLRQFGLLKTLEDYIDSIALSKTVEAKFMCNIQAEAVNMLRWKDQLSIYRICQEVLTNILKHAKCNTITLSVVSNTDEILFEFEHNGAGITNDDIETLRNKGLGLNSLKTRALLLRAMIDYAKTKNSAMIKLTVPLHDKKN